MQLDIKLPGCELFEELQLTQSYSRSFIIALIRLFKNIKQMLRQHQHCHAAWTEYLTKRLWHWLFRAKAMYPSASQEHRNDDSINFLAALRKGS